MENWTKDEKMAYYFWIDNLVLSHWSEYLDLKLDEENDNDVLSENKLKLIDLMTQLNILKYQLVPPLEYQ